MLYFDTSSNISGTDDYTTRNLGDQIILGTTFLTIAFGILITIFLWRRHRLQKQLISSTSSASKTRFRKRDKVLFYGRKMLRKVKTFSSSANKRKRILSKITKKLLHLKNTGTDAKPSLQLHVLEPAAEYLQEDVTNKGDKYLPPEVTYMLQSIRMFGIFEKPLFLELCKHMETVQVMAGQYLFRVGDADENFYVVQSGRLNVFITELDGTTITLKLVKEGDSIASLLSFTDVLTGHPQPFKTVSAQALEDSIVLKLPVQAFQEVFEKYPETFVRVIQIIMVRLNRVTFTALHQHLGLSHELVQTSGSAGGGRRKLQQQQQQGQQVSPVRRNTVHHLPPGEMNSQTPDLLDSDATPTNTGANANFQFGQYGSEQDPPTNSSFLRKRNSIPVQIGVQHPSSAASSGGSFGETFAGEPHSTHSLGHVGHPQSHPSHPHHVSTSDLDSDALLRQAIQAFRINLGLDSDALLKDIIHLKDIPAGAYLVKEDCSQPHPPSSDLGLVFVLSGLLTLTQRENNDRDALMFNAHPGEFVGALAVLTGEPSIFTIRAKHHTRVGFMSASSFYTLMANHPKIVLHVAHIVVKRLSPFVRQIDFSMDWIFLEGGRALYRQGDESDCTYIVLSGRLRSVITRPDGKKQLVGEHGRGDLVGIVETLTSYPRSTTVMAVRDTELAKLPEGLLNAIKLKYPVVLTKLIQLLGHRILGSWQQGPVGVSTPKLAQESKPSHVNFSTVAVLAVTDDVPLSAFTFELIHSLTNIGHSLRLTSDYMKQLLGHSIMDSANEYKLNNWLAQQEDKHRIVLYQCDNTLTVWTQRCIRQADCILIVGLGENDGSIGKVEKQLEHLAVRTQKELVLLHKEGSRPKDTAVWLNARTWCSSHHHLQCPKRMFSRKARGVGGIGGGSGGGLQGQGHSDYYEQVVMKTEPNIHSDFSRLARWLTGTSVGLVLGGGGARGAAHVGMLKAIQEAGIPVDMVGGVSIGAFMSGLYAMERNIVSVTQKAREWSKKMTQWWRQALDLTYPVTSMFSGAGFNQTLKDTFGDQQIEDLWLPYFNITTDITSSAMRVHTHGSLWRYTRASMSLSGYMPPLCDPNDGHLLLDGGYVCNLPWELWFYCRASMSIAGVFPPLCDREDGHLLLDGVYSDLIGADVMRAHGARYILAVDVGSQDETDFTNYGDSLSGWWLLWQKWTSAFRSTAVKVPNLPDIQSRLAYVSCVRQLEEVKNSGYCHYIRPPIDKYKTLQFGSFDEIKDVGYNHGKTYFDGMMKGGGGILQIGGNWGVQSGGGQGGSGGDHHPHHQMVQRVGSSGSLGGGRDQAKKHFQQGSGRMGRPISGSYNFTDLAQLVVQVRRGPQFPGNEDDEDDYSEYEEDIPEGYQSEHSLEYIHQAKNGTNGEPQNEKQITSSDATKGGDSGEKTGSHSENDADSS